MRNLQRGWVQARIAGRRHPREVVPIAPPEVLRSRSAAADTGAVADTALLYVGRRMRKRNRLLPIKGQFPRTHHELAADAGEREQHSSQTLLSPVRPCRSSLSVRLGLQRRQLPWLQSGIICERNSPCFWSYFRMSCTTFGRSAMLELYRSCRKLASVACAKRGRASGNLTYGEFLVIGKVFAPGSQCVHERQQSVDRGRLGKDFAFHVFRGRTGY